MNIRDYNRAAWDHQVDGGNEWTEQGPILSAAGAKVTVLDNSPNQLKQDRLVAEREKLDLSTVEGDVANLSMFGDGSFDLVFHPCSNLFVPHVRPVWKEAFAAGLAAGYRGAAGGPAGALVARGRQAISAMHLEK